MTFWEMAREVESLQKFYERDGVSAMMNYFASDDDDSFVQRADYAFGQAQWIKFLLKRGIKYAWMRLFL